jgi:transposase-like protein
MNLSFPRRNQRMMRGHGGNQTRSNRRATRAHFRARPARKRNMRTPLFRKRSSRSSQRTSRPARPILGMKPLSIPRTPWGFFPGVISLPTKPPGSQPATSTARRPVSIRSLSSGGKGSDCPQEKAARGADGGWLDPRRRSRPRTTPQQRLMILDCWRRSGLPAQDFATLVGVSKHTLYAWKQRFTREGPAGLLEQPRGAHDGSRLPDLTKRTILLHAEGERVFLTRAGGLRQEVDLVPPATAADAAAMPKAVCPDGSPAAGLPGDTPAQAHDASLQTLPPAPADQQGGKS